MHKHLKLFSLLFSFLLFCIYSDAQVMPSDTSGSKVIIISNDDASADHTTSDPAKNNYHNLIRWNMFDMGRGIFSLGYEHSLSKIFSIDFNLGYTLQDYMGELEDNDNVNYLSSHSSGGFAFMAGARIYPGKNGDMQGFYIAPHYYFKNYNTEETVTYTSYSSSYSSTSYPGTLTINRKVSDLGLRIGWQFPLWQPCMMDFNFGFAMRTVNRDKVTEVNSYDSTGSTTSIGYITVNDTRNVPAFLIG